MNPAITNQKNVIRIFNYIENKEILIDGSLHNVKVVPFDYDEDNPKFFLEIKGFDYLRHSQKCEDCASLLKSLGTKCCNWFIEYNGLISRLDLHNFGSGYNQTMIRYTICDFECGTKFQFRIDTDTIESLELMLEIMASLEYYEDCIELFEKIRNIKQAGEI